jgi:Mg2+/Co2+ transporter CorB
VVTPPMQKTVERKLTGILDIPELDVYDIMLDVIEAMRNDDPFSKAVEIMVVGVQGF